MRAGQTPALCITPEIHPGKESDTNRIFPVFCRRTGMGHQTLDHPPKVGLPFLGDVPSSLKPHRTKYLGGAVACSSFTKKYYSIFTDARNERKLIRIVLYIHISNQSFPLVISMHISQLNTSMQLG